MVAVLEHSRLQLVLLVPGRQGRPPTQHGVDLLLLVVRVIVLGIVSESRWQLDHLYAE